MRVAMTRIPNSKDVAPAPMPSDRDARLEAICTRLNRLTHAEVREHGGTASWLRGETLVA
jgi:hypothetical protein